MSRKGKTGELYTNVRTERKPVRCSAAADGRPSAGALRRTGIPKGCRVTVREAICRLDKATPTPRATLSPAKVKPQFAHLTGAHKANPFNPSTSRPAGNNLRTIADNYNYHKLNYSDTRSGGTLHLPVLGRGHMQTSSRYDTGVFFFFPTGNSETKYDGRLILV
jgi:hypothetical protein